MRYQELVEAKVWKLQTLAPNSVSTFTTINVLENPSWAAVQTLLGRSHYDAIKGFLATTTSVPVPLMWSDDIQHDDIENAFYQSEGIRLRHGRGDMLADLLLLGSAKSVQPEFAKMPFPVLLYRNASTGSLVEQNVSIKRWPCRIINYDRLRGHAESLWL
jgi:hypothetical protein